MLKVKSTGEAFGSSLCVLTAEGEVVVKEESIPTEIKKKMAARILPGGVGKIAN